MAIGSFRYSSALFAFLWLLLGGLAFAQQSGNTSGPSSGTNVQPSTAIQKENSAGKGDTPSGAGAPGVEGKPGSKSGPSPQDRTAQPPK